MFGLHTYRARLLVYVSLLLTFLLGVLIFAYTSSRAVIMREADNNLARIARQIEGQLVREGQDLLERARMVGENTQLMEYTYIALAVGADEISVRNLYQRQFGWLPVSRVVLLSQDGKAVLGGEHGDLIDLLRAQQSAPREGQFYFNGRQGFERVATAVVHYRSQTLGVVALTQSIDHHWLEATRRMSGGHLFLVENGKVSLTSAGTPFLGRPFDGTTGVQEIEGERYLVKSVNFTTAATPLPSLWLALSDTELTARLITQRDVILGIALAGCLGILMVGFMLLRNFTGPLGHLVKVMQAVGEGQFPEIQETRSRDEFGYLLKQFSAMVTSLREKQEEITRAHQQLEQEATTDALTGCYNRRYLYDLYPRLWSEALRSEKRLAVLIIDIDFFKPINDEYGHLTGDEVLRHFAATLMNCCRRSDFLFRLGGEEFLVLTTGDIEGGQVLAEKIRSAVERMSVPHEQRSIRITVSVGVAQAEASDGLNGLGTVLSRADRALYTAKQTGRNRVTVAEIERVPQSGPQLH